MKKISMMLASALVCCFSACAAQRHVAHEAKRPHFYKEGVSDRQMTQDLNECSRVAFLGSKLQPEGSYRGGPDPRCMRSLGYEVF